MISIHLFTVASDGFSAGLQTTGLSLWLRSPISGRVQHETKPHHARNVTQFQVKAESFMPLDRSAVHDSLLGTVDAGAEVLAAMVERCSDIHLQTQPT